MNGSYDIERDEEEKEKEALLLLFRFIINEHPNEMA